MTTIRVWTCDRCPEHLEAPLSALWSLIGEHYAQHPIRMAYGKDLACDGDLIPTQRVP